MKAQQTTEQLVKRLQMELAALNELSRSLAARLSVVEVLDEAYRGLVRVLDATDLYIALYDPEKNQVTFAVEALNGQVTRPYSTQQADRGLTGYLIRTRAPLLIQNANQGQEEALGVENIPFRPTQLSRCWLGAPLIAGDRVLGTMAVLNYTDPYAFDEHDRELLTAIAGQTAIALENARLFEQMRASEARFRDVALASAGWVWETDAQGHYTYCSERVVEVLDYTAEEMLGKTTFAHLTPQDAERVRSDLMELFANKQPMVDLEYRKTAKDGREVVLISNGVPILDDHGNLLGYRGVDRDITQRRQAEEAEREQRMLAEALRDSASALAGSLSLDEVLDHILEQIAIVVPHDAATVMLIEGDIAQIVRSRGYAERGLAPVLTSRFRIAELPSLRSMLETKQPILIADTDEDPTWVQLSEREWVHSYISAPIQVKGQVIGFLNLNSATRGSFGPKHIRRLLAFADQAGVALENAHLFEETMKSLVEAEALYRATQAVSRLGGLQETLQTLANVLVEQVGYRSAWIARVDKQARLLKGLVGAGLAETGNVVAQEIPLDARIRNPLVQVVFKKEPIVVNDATSDERTLELSEEARAMLGRTVAVPLLVDGEAVGVMTVQRPLSAPEFTDRDVELLLAIANQASVAWQNNHLLEESQENLLDLQTIANLTTHLLASQDIHQAGDLLVRQVLEHGADRCTIALRNEVGEETGLEIIAAADTDRTTAEQLGVGKRTPLNQMAFIQSAYQNKQALFFPDVKRAVILSEQEKQLQINLGERALAVLPLTEGSDMVGHLSIAYREPHEFSVREIGFYTALTGQAAVVMQSIRRLEETRSRARRERILREVALAISASPDVAASLPDIARQLRQLVPVDTAALVVRPPDAPQVILQAIHAQIETRRWAKSGDHLSLKSSGPGWVVTKGQVRLETDIRSSQPFAEDAQLAAAGLAARLILPLTVSGEAIGALDLASTQPGAYTEDHAAMLRPVADQMALALERARLLQETRTALSEVEATTRRYLRQQWETYLAGAREQRTSYLDVESGPAPARDVWQPEMEQALVLGTPVNMTTNPGSDETPARTVLAVPIKLRGQPIGVLDFYNEGGERAWGEEEQALVVALADQIALALENARLFEQTQQRARREQLIAEIAAKMRAAPDVEGVLRATVHEIRRALGVSHGTIRLGETAHTPAGNGQTGEGDDRDE